MPGARRCAAALALATLCASAPAGASALVHTAKSGDTPERLAAEYYGNRSLAFYIREVNRLPRGVHLRRGQRVQVPTAFHIRLKRGENLEDIARRFLDDERRAPFLASWSGLRQGEKAAEGTDVLVPYQWAYRAGAPESLAAVAKMFYGDAGQAKMLADYNFRGTGALAAGERLTVPLPRLRVRSVYLAGPPMMAKARAVPHHGLPLVAPAAEADAQRREAELANRVAERLRQAEKAYRDGNYDDVPAQLTKLLSEEDPSEAQLVAIHRLLAFAYVALGTEAVAVKEFREVLQREPEASLDAATVSPKIRAAFERAKLEK